MSATTPEKIYDLRFAICDFWQAASVLPGVSGVLGTLPRADAQPVVNQRTRTFNCQCISRSTPSFNELEAMTARLRQFAAMLLIAALAFAGCGLVPEKVSLTDPQVEPLLKAMDQVDRAALGFTPLTTNAQIRLIGILFAWLFNNFWIRIAEVLSR